MLDPQDFDFLDPDPENINQKLQKKTFLLLKPKSELFKKRDYKNFLISKWFIKF